MNAFLSLAEVPSQALVIVAFAAVILVFFVMLGIWMSRYTKVGPDQVLVVSGRRYLVRDSEGKAHEMGYRIIKGGGTFVFPIVEKAEVLSLKPVSIELPVRNILTRDGGHAEVTARGQFRISGDDLSLTRAAQSLLGKTPEQTKEIAAELLESSLRSLLGAWTGSELSQRQSDLGVKWQDAVKEGLGTLGLTMLSLSIRDVKMPQRIGT